MIQKVAWEVILNYQLFQNTQKLTWTRQIMLIGSEVVAPEHVSYA